MAATLSPALAWNTHTRDDWDRFIAAAGRSSLEQCWAYGEAVAAHHGLAVDRGVVMEGEAPLAALQLFRRRVLGLATIVRLVRGPLWFERPRGREGEAAAYRAIRRRFSRWRREALIWMPELPDAPQSHALMRAAGTRRVVTGYSSAWLDLRPGEEAVRAALAGKWRNTLRAAERAKTVVRRASATRDLAPLMAHYDAFRRAKRFIGPPGGLITAFGAAAPDDTIVLTARVGGDAIAGVVLLCHGASATYFVSWTSAEGRRRHAHNLLLWRGIVMLIARNTRWLDLGGLDTVSAPGVARFKLGLRPAVFTLAGTYF